jgi:hypothetical protein
MASENQKFTLFPDLPKELRLKIWEFAQESRIVEVCQTQDRATFYSPTALPAVLQTSSESRHIALLNYSLSFRNGDSPATIYYNSSIDILYFPAWCDDRGGIWHFERNSSPEARGKIKRLAIDNLVWYADWNDGMINNQVTIGEFRGLEEFLLVEREPDETGCGCCHEFDGPEEGVVSFGEKDKQDKHDKRRLYRCKKVYKAATKGDKEWKIPSMRFVRLLRDGIIV